MQNISAVGIKVRLEKSICSDPTEDIIQKAEELDTDMNATMMLGRIGLARFVFVAVAVKFLQKCKQPLLSGFYCTYRFY